MDAHRNVVVTVHGVGDPAPGGTLRALAAGLPGPPGSYQRADLILGRELYPRLVSSAPALPDLIEVNWADLQRPPRSWSGALRHVLGLAMGLATVRFDWCDEAPAVRTQQACQDVVQGAVLWSLWPVLLTLVHTAVAPAGLAKAWALEALLVLLLVPLAHSQWRSTARVTVAGYVWLGLCLGLLGVLWFVPTWAAMVTRLSIRVYGLAQLVAVTALLAMGVEVVSRGARGLIPWRRGLVGFTLAVVPLVLLSLFGACVWALVLNGILAVGGQPVENALKGWQQLFTGTLGYHLASVEWAAAWGTGCVAVLALCAAAHSAWRCRGDVTRRWFGAIVVVVPLGFVLVALIMLLSSPYLGAPLARAVQRCGAGADVATIYTWSAFRLLPWLVLLATPAWQVLDVLGDVGYYLMPPGEQGISSRVACRERLSQLLLFLDRGRCDRIHVVAHSQGAIIALDVLQSTSLHHPLALTTAGSPAGTLYRDLLDWPLEVPGNTPADWCNLFRQGDPIGGPVDSTGVDDVELPGCHHTDYWPEPLLTERVVQVLQAPLPAPRA
jgi:hypothetical protein